MSSLQQMFGVTVPTSNYINSITESFPTNKRDYKLEASIADRNLRDFLPTNSNMNNGSVNDNYIEFILDSNDQEFYDLSTFHIEMKMKITKADGSSLDGNSNVTVVDGLANRLLNRSSVYLNSIPVENNAHFGVCSVLKNYLNLSKDSIKGIGRNMYYKASKTKIFDKIVAATFENENKTRDETQIMLDVQNEMHMVAPINLDIATSNFYLLPSVDIRIRFDLAPASMVINSHDNENYKYSLTSVKLWGYKVVPIPGALLSLTKHLSLNNSSIEYLYEKPIVKTYILPSGHSSIVLDNIFNGVIPNQLYTCIIAQTAANGSYSRNACYFTDCNMSNITLDINGNTVSKLECEFPSKVAQLFYHSITNISNPQNLLTLENFKSGRTILAWNLNPTDADDVINLERTGNLRMNLQFSKSARENFVIYVMGTISGIFEIDANKRVITNNKM